MAGSLNGLLWAISALVLSSAALASAPAELDASPSSQVPTVTVIGTTPVPGATIDIDKVPSNVESLSTAALTQGGPASLLGALQGRLGSITLNDTLADPFQPDLYYRGFAASAVLGTPQGLAVYQNGVRINEAFGDAVNWDLIPDIAISRLDLVSASPVYGLNALGGAATLTMKDGFNYKGGELELSGGSFHQRNASAQFGMNNGRLGFYAAGRILNEDGWRFSAHDRVRQFYTALSGHTDSATFNLAYTHANNSLYGPGAAPVQSLALDSRNIFTAPQSNLNRLDFVTLDASYTLADDLSIQSVLYHRDYRQSVTNGNTSNYTACTPDDTQGLLCQADGITPLTSTTGTPIPDISNGGATTIGENDFETIHSRGLGGSLQLHGTQSLGNHGNQFTAGASVDSAHVNFSSGAQLGVLSPQLVVLPSDLFVDTAEGSAFSATPVVLKATNRYYGFFATDTFDATSALTFTISARYNVAQINLYDQRGPNLNGSNRYAHFNPAFGATYKVSSWMTAYGGYSKTNRAPTASEIECSDPLLPCLLPANLAGDPPTLKQVIADTYEAGLRGRVAVTSASEGTFRWDVGAFRTTLHDDIYAIATSLSNGFFQNIGSTRRQGAQVALTFTWAKGQAYLNYSYVEATFESAFKVSSPSNPQQDTNGDIQITAGDRLPGIPQHRLKGGVDYELLRNWTIGGTCAYLSSQFYRGDESNQNPPLPGYAVLGLHTSFQFRKQSELFLTVQNLFDRRYATYGLYSDPTGVGAPGIPADANSNDPGVDNRFQNPAAPRSVFGGVRIAF